MYHKMMCVLYGFWKTSGEKIHLTWNVTYIYIFQGMWIMLNILCKFEYHENHRHFIYITTAVNMGVIDSTKCQYY